MGSDLCEASASRRETRPGHRLLWTLIVEWPIDAAADRVSDPARDAGNSLLCCAALREAGIDAASFTAIRIVSGALVLWLIVRVRDRGTTGTGTGSGSWLSAGALFAYAACFSFAYMSLQAGTGTLLLFGAVQAVPLPMVPSSSHVTVVPTEKKEPESGELRSSEHSVLIRHIRPTRGPSSLCAFARIAASPSVDTETMPARRQNACCRCVW